MFGWRKETKQPISAEWIEKSLKEIAKLNPDNTPEEDIRYSEQHDSGIRYSRRVDDSSLQDDYFKWSRIRKFETFQEMFLRLMQEKKVGGREFCKGSLIDRKLFWAIKNQLYYRPQKETAVACCFGLKLSLAEAEELLAKAGYVLSLSISWDRVIYYCLLHGITDIDAVNALLYANGDKSLRM